MTKITIKKLTIALSALLMLTLFSCNVAQMPVSEEALTMESSENAAVDSYVEENENFVNGINQAYLKERGISEEELVNEILAEAALEKSSTEEATRGFNFDSTGFFDVVDIVKNPAKYFKCSVNISGSNSYVDVGLSQTKLNQTLKYMPEIILENSKTKKIKAYDFSIGEVSSYNIIVNGRIHAKIYKRIFGKYRKILDVKGKVKVAVAYRYDKNTNELVFEKYKVKSVVGGPIITLAGKIFTRTKFAKGNLTQRVELKFLPKQYLIFERCFTSKEYLYTRLWFKKSDLNRVISYARMFGITIKI